MDFTDALSYICMLRLFCVMYYILCIRNLYGFSLTVSFIEYNNFWCRNPENLL